MYCEECKYYEWYCDLCKKWNCKIDGRSVQNCFEEMDTPVLDFMISQKA